MMFFNYKKQIKEEFKIIYMPTFHGKKGSEIDLLTDFNFILEKWDKFLEENNAKLYIKIHPVNLLSGKILRKLKGYKNIVFLEIDGIYETIRSFDILITDYSSIYFDYLLLDSEKNSRVLLKIG